jgi:hypothetical protein
MEARKGGAMRLRLGVTFCSVLFLALLISPIAADMGSPSHSCSKPKPYDPIEIGSKTDLEMYNDSVNRYKRCIEQFVEEQNKAVKHHHEAALAATEEYNSFVKAWVK